MSVLFSKNNYIADMNIDEIKYLCQSLEELYNNKIDIELYSNTIKEAKENLESLRLETYKVGVTGTNKKNILTVISYYEKIIQKHEKHLLLYSNQNMSQEQMQDRSLELLLESRKKLIESEEVAADTLNTLHKQREQLINSQSKLRDINANLSLSNKLLRAINQWWRK
jgi:hypothetical protein